MLKILQVWGPLPLLIVACCLETSGDALIRIAIYKQSGWFRGLLLIAGAALVFGYANFVNFAPVEFGRVAGYYIAILFLTWQVSNWVYFRTVPTVPIMVGGAFIIVGGVIMSFWKVD